MKKFLIILVAVVMAMSATAAGDEARKSTIHLKSGEFVVGTIISRTSENVEIETDDGMKYVYAGDEIDYISHETKKKNYDTSKFRGFVDLGYSLGFGAPRNNYWLIETSFGYQFNIHWYLGAGIGLHKFNAIVSSYPPRTDYAEPRPNDPDLDRFPFIPLYAETRYNLHSESHHTPWASLKVGGSIFNHGGLFLSPSIGYHFATSKTFSFNLGVGYALHTAHYKLWCTGDTPGAIPDKSGRSYLDRNGIFHNAFLKLGVEF